MGVERTRLSCVLLAPWIAIGKPERPAQGRGQLHRMRETWSLDNPRMVTVMSNLEETGAAKLSRAASVLTVGLGQNLSNGYLMLMLPTIPPWLWPGMVHFRSPKWPVLIATNHHSVIPPGYTSTSRICPFTSAVGLPSAPLT
jgi:hypothetical protein